MNLSPLPVQRFYSNLGLPLVGGKLFTYAAGTTTKIATYSDSSGTLNTNPVRMNFRGECNVWLDPTLTYKFVLSPSTDTDPPTNPIWTVDNISALGLTRQIIGQLYYPQSLPEAGLTIVNYYEYYGDVRRYGALVDGSTDDTSAWQASITQARAGGADVTMPTGTSIVNINAAANVLQLGSGITVSGAGVGVSILRTTGTPSSDRTLLFIEAAQSAYIRNMTLIGPASDGVGSCKGIRHGGTSGTLKLEDMDISSFTDGIKKDSGASCVMDFTRVDSHGNRNQGFLDVKETGDTTLVNCNMYGNGTTNLHHGVYHQAGTNFRLRVIGGSYHGNSGYGINRFSTTATASSVGAVEITGASFYSNTTGDLIIDDVSSAVSLTADVSSCSFRSATGVFVWANNLNFASCSFVCSTKCVDTTGASGTGAHVNFAACDFRYGGSLGVELTSSAQQYWTFDDSCLFKQTGSGTADTGLRIDGATDIKISARFISNGGQPVRIRNSANRIRFKDAEFYGTTNTTGVYIQSSATDPGDYAFQDCYFGMTDRGLTIEVSGASVEACDLTAPSSKISLTGGKTIRTRNNRGYISENGGVTGAIATGTTVTHGITGTPAIILLTALDVGPTDIYVTAIGATTFTINYGGGGTHVFAWEAQLANYYTA